MSRCLVHLASGVGNIVLTTPLLIALHELGLRVHVLLDADYAETADLLQPWSVIESVHDGGDGRAIPSCEVVVPAIPPFYWPRFRNRYASMSRVVARPPDRLFYANEQQYYLAFARALGYSRGDAPACALPVGPVERDDVGLGTLVLAPGCKTGEMAAKRWPFFAHLAARFPDVAVVGTRDDDRMRNGDAFQWPSHVRSFIGSLTLRQTAELMAGAGAVVANDSGLAHVAAAVGTRTVMLFGPTPHETLGPLGANVIVIRAGLACEPCWFGARFAACDGRIDCLQRVDVERVETAVRGVLGQ